MIYIHRQKYLYLLKAFALEPKPSTGSIAPDNKFILETGLVSKFSPSSLSFVMFSNEASSPIATEPSN